MKKIAALFVITIALSSCGKDNTWDIIDCNGNFASAYNGTERSVKKQVESMSRPDCKFTYAKR
jgi:hypothetical protein